MTLRTDPEFEDAIRFLADRDSTSKQDAVRRAVIESARRLGHEATLLEISSEMRSRWDETLDRLGTV